MAIPQDQRKSILARQAASMTLSVVQTEQPMAMVRAAAWCNALARSGLHAPMFIVHDIGLLLSMSRGPGGYDIALRSPHLTRITMSGPSRTNHEAYRRLIQNIAESDIAERLSGMRLRDELIGVLLARIISDTYNRWKDKPKTSSQAPLPLDIEQLSDIDFASHFADFDPRGLWSWLDHVAASALGLYTQVELIDLDTVRLLGMFKDSSGSTSQALGGSIDLVDLFAALGSPQANDVANFSLDLLPSVLETRKSSGVQTFAIDGYASIERQGNVDSLVLSELAYPREIFDQKVVDNELLYYGRDKHREDEQRLQYVLIDASASMRGQRQVFARGLALALIKKLTLKGDEIWLRFFDSRLHETVKIARSAQVPVPYVLSFSSERGRNYGRVFRQLVAEMAKLRSEQRKQVVVYIITHGQCHVEPELIAQLKASAFLYGIIVIPNGPLPEFVSLLNKQQVVDGSVVTNRRARQKRALDIVGDASADGHASTSAIGGGPHASHGHGPVATAKAPVL